MMPWICLNEDVGSTWMVKGSVAHAEDEQRLTVGFNSGLFSIERVDGASRTGTWSFRRRRRSYRVGAPSSHCFFVCSDIQVDPLAPVRLLQP